MQEHVTEKLSSYLHHELPKDERQAVGEHLLRCESCRRAHDEIKLGAGLAAHLGRADAPPEVWSGIEARIDGEERRQTHKAAYFPAFGPRGAALSAAAVLFVFVLLAGVYLGFFREKTADVAEIRPTPKQTNIAEIGPTPNQTNAVETTPGEISPDQNAAAPPAASVDSKNDAPKNDDSNGRTATPTENRVVPAAPKNASKPKTDRPAEKVTPQIVSGGWSVETLSGSPRAGNQTIAENGKLSVGQFLETDANSRARVQVADIGEVEVAPNSRVQLVKTHSTEHRLSLERGTLQAKILAPPRLFIVDTPSAVAVDLGCEYTLEVDQDGNSRLHVTSGYVALERDGRESIVPAGAICFTRRGRGLGTPFSVDASKDFQMALTRFDFENGGSDSLQTIIRETNLYDVVTLWHLLARVPSNDREKVFDALAAQVPPPPPVTRAGALRLDKKMLDAWWSEIENVWFEN